MFKLRPLVFGTYDRLSGAVLGTLLRLGGKAPIVIGVVGTKGKTTIIELLSLLFESAGYRTAVCSTVRIKVGEASATDVVRGHAPSIRYLQKFIRAARDNHCAVVFIELTSADVERHHYRSIQWSAMVFTNLTPEHVERDYSFDEYRHSKLVPLRYALSRGAKIFLNGDDPQLGFLMSGLGASEADPHVILYSVRDQAWLTDILPNVTSPMLHAHHDLLAGARAVAIAAKIPEEILMRTYATFEGVPGRMEFVQTEPFAIVIDLARTPESLLKTYEMLRNSEYLGKGGKLIAVLGCSGAPREAWKRPIVGRIAAEYCETVILTTEDPHDANPREIVDDMVKGFDLASSKALMTSNSYIIEFDRRKAIEQAIKMAEPGDVLIVTGKGNETWMHMERGSKALWDERGVVREILEKDKKSSSKALLVTEPVKAE